MLDRSKGYRTIIDLGHWRAKFIMSIDYFRDDPISLIDDTMLEKVWFMSLPNSNI